MKWNISNKKIIEETKISKGFSIVSFGGMLISVTFTTFSASQGDMVDVVGWLCLFWIFLGAIIIHTSEYDYNKTKFLILNQEELKKQKRRLDRKNENKE